MIKKKKLVRKVARKKVAKKKVTKKVAKRKKVAKKKVTKKVAKRKKAVKKKKRKRRVPGLRGISISGFKSIAEKISMELKPLTILAGANSTGKSSMIQPLLLLKQTLEEAYDPGSILLNGPLVKFSSADQILSHDSISHKKNQFSIGLTDEDNYVLTLDFKKSHKGFAIDKMTYKDGKTTEVFTTKMTSKEKMGILKKVFPSSMIKKLKPEDLEIIRTKCVLGIRILSESFPFPPIMITPTSSFENYLQDVIYLPGLRGMPERSYPVTAVENRFPGKFEKYVASIISDWQANGKIEKIDEINKDLRKLRLTDNIKTEEINDTDVGIHVSRLNHDPPDTKDMVNIADVGLGVSQVLPIIVAIHIAKKGQIVFIEQPELHLHPRAQYALTEILSDAAKRGVCVIIETHSQLMLLGIQAAVAQGKIPSSKVILHWFSRNPEGITEISTANLDRTGAFGDWPEDFSDVELEAESNYLDAAEKKLFGAK